MDAPCEERFVGYILPLTLLPPGVAHLEAPQSCSSDPRVDTVLFTVSCCPLSLSLSSWLIVSHTFIFHYCPDSEILTASTACGYQAWDLIPGFNNKMPLQEQIVNGYKRSYPAAWMPGTLSLSPTSFVSVPLLPPPSRTGRNEQGFL